MDIYQAAFHPHISLCRAPRSSSHKTRSQNLSNFIRSCLFPQHANGLRAQAISSSLHSSITIALRRHIPLIFFVLFFADQECDARPLAAEILHFGSRFALLLVSLRGVHAVPLDYSSPTLPGMRSHNASSTRTFNATASAFHAAVLSSATNHTSNIITNVTDKLLWASTTRLQPLARDLPDTDLTDQFDDIIGELAKITGFPPATIIQLATMMPSIKAQSTSAQMAPTQFTPRIPRRTAKLFTLLVMMTMLGSLPPYRTLRPRCQYHSKSAAG